MTWEKAKQEIKKHVKKGDDVNTVPGINKNGKVSTVRFVKCVCDWGYRIPKGENSYMSVTWEMLEKCWNGMVDNKGIYDPKAISHKAPCYPQTIHMIFREAGLT